MPEVYLFSSKDTDKKKNEEKEREKREERAEERRKRAIRENMKKGDVTKHLYDVKIEKAKSEDIMVEIQVKEEKIYEDDNLICQDSPK